MSKSSFLLIFFWVWGSLYAKINHPLERILPKLEIVENSIRTVIQNASTSNRQMRYFNDENLRNQLRDLQNLFRLYQKKYPVLKEYKKTLKEFEDHISHLRDLDGSGTERERTAREAYEKFLKESSLFQLDADGSSVYMTKMFVGLNALEWMPIEKDRNYLLKRMAKIIKKNNEEEYELVTDAATLSGMCKRDKEDLVEDNIHELRRDVRRIFYLNYGTTTSNGSDRIVRRSNSIPCPLGQSLDEVKYNLDYYHPGEDYKCYVSSCLLDRLEKESNKFSRMKGQGARAIHYGDDMSLASVFQLAKDRLDGLHTDEVYLHLSAQLKMCRDSNKDSEIKDEK